MACYHPVTAYQCSNGEVVFAQLARYDIHHTLSLPCGQCIGCRLERSRQWAMRCMHEASQHDENAFITLTYDDDHFPVRGCLVYPDFQKFIKRLRKHFKGRKIGYYMCGEYGSLNWRPHFHACLFNVDFQDKELWTERDSVKLFTSSLLSRLWPFGFSTTADVTFESAAYTARYCLKKVTGDLAKFHYARSDAAGPYLLPSEFNHMSLKPGIGAGWARDFLMDVFPHDYVIVNGHKSRTPRYYDTLYGRLDEVELDQVKFGRELKGRRHAADNTPERLQAKEAVAAARVSLLKRSMETYA